MQFWVSQEYKTEQIHTKEKIPWKYRREAISYAWYPASPCPPYSSDKVRNFTMWEKQFFPPVLLQFLGSKLFCPTLPEHVGSELYPKPAQKSCKQNFFLLSQVQDSCHLLPSKLSTIILFSRLIWELCLIWQKEQFNWVVLCITH